MELTDEMKKIFVKPMASKTIEELEKELEWERHFTGMSFAKRIEKELCRRKAV